VKYTKSIHLIWKTRLGSNI